MPQLSAIILAAGEGTRLKSGRAKVLHRLAGRPLVHWVLQAARTAGVRRQVVVLGHQAGEVRGVLPAEVRTAVQAKRLGTAHAVLCARSALRGVGGEVLVLCGDAPLIGAGALRRLVAAHRRARAAATVLTAVLDRPAGYGRIVRDPKHPGRVAAIVEERDATPEQRRLREVNSGAYCFSLAELWPALARVGNRNRKREYYLTDVVALLRASGRTVQAMAATEAAEVLGVNSRSELAQAEAVLNRRTVERLMDSGVTVLDPSAVWIEPGVRIGRDTLVLPGTLLRGDTVIGRDCRLGPNTQVDSSRLGDGVRVRQSVVEDCRIGNGVRIGPFSHLRGGTQVAPGAYIGNFAEANRSRIGARVKQGHFSYLGDAVVGADTNIGAGAITANYDGRSKHPTRIGPGAFIGSGTVIVAPAVIGAGALTGAGSVLKRNTVLPPNTVAVGVPARVIKKRR
jgi:bifunctional UDP-N-acetylglucosamine pyrophosphorylase / glucosamine-1-phosphate N-acetyltransferase